MAKKNYVVEFYRRKDRLWEWRIVAPNGNIVATSGDQGYTRKSGVVKSFEAIKSAIHEFRMLERMGNNEHI